MTQDTLIRDSVFETEENGIQDNTYVEGDKAKMYEERGYLLYPNIILETDELKNHQVTLINNIVGKASLLEKEQYYIYLKLKDLPQAVEVGTLTKDRLHVVMGKAFNSFTKKIMLSDNDIYEGDLVYAFIPPMIDMG